MSGRSLSIEDKFAIMELVSRYNHAIDGGDPAGVADCFIENGTFRGRSGFFSGRQELMKLGMTASGELLPRHIVSNILIDARDGEHDAADIKSHLFYYEVTPQGFHFKTSGVYTDVVERTGSGWRFRSRVMTLDVASPSGSSRVGA
jgi:hypothetical protein